MSRIVIDARELRTSSGRYVERLLHYLQQIDHDNHYQILLKPRDLADWQPSNPNFSKLACPYKEFSLGEQLGFYLQLRELKADLVHFPMAQQPLLYRGRGVTTMNDLTTVRFRNLSKNRLIFWWKQRVYSWLNRRVAHKAAALITYSQFVKNDVAAFTSVNPDKITVTHLAADKITVPAEPVAGLMGKQFLLYVGRPMSHKNLERLIEAFASLKAQHPHLQLVLAGNSDANYQRLEAWTQKRGIQGVIFPGFVSEGSLRWLYENCVAYVFPSLSEGFGLPGLEAMTHGAPVLSSNATCLPEIYGEAAHYFDPLDVQAMADAINEVLTDKNLRTNLIKKGAEQVKKYSWHHTAEQTLAIYEKALRGN
ncbi:MAG TPA: glycosyltransferase family 1 protein [Candidatus Saccharimonadales bacterium]